jgi:hypothetical protein
LSVSGFTQLAGNLGIEPSKGVGSCSLTFAEAEQLKQDPRACILLRETCRHFGKVKCYALSVRPTGPFDLFSLQDLTGLSRDLASEFLADQ